MYRLHLIGIDMNTFSGDDEPKKFSAGHSEEGFGGVHLQLMTPHEIEHRLQVLNVIILITALKQPDHQHSIRRSSEGILGRSSSLLIGM